jgi:hypothetical protein
LELEVTIHVMDALAKVEIRIYAFALHIGQSSSEDRDRVVTLEFETNAIGALGKVHSTPLEGTVIVSDTIVEVELGIDHFTLFVSETGPKHVAIVDTGILSWKVERHVQGVENGECNAKKELAVRRADVGERARARVWGIAETI